MPNLITIDPSALYSIINELDYKGHLENHPSYDWELVDSKLESSDEEDGGGHYIIVLKHIPSDKLYQTSYSDWDVENTDFDEKKGIVIGRCDLNCRLYQVVPKQITITSYERV